MLHLVLTEMIIFFKIRNPFVDYLKVGHVYTQIQITLTTVSIQIFVEIHLFPLQSNQLLQVKAKSHDSSNLRMKLYHYQYSLYSDKYYCVHIDSAFCQ